MPGLWYNLVGSLAETLVRAKARSRHIQTWDGRFRETKRFYRVPLDGCVCSDGSPYFMYMRRGTTDKTLIHLAGGGFSWDEETAAMPLSIRVLANRGVGYYNQSCGIQTDLSLGGIVSENDPRNPLNEWNMVCIPYVTGDLHIGDNDFPYTGSDGEKRILHHHGRRNFHAAMRTAMDRLPPPCELVVSGNSAGGFGCVALAPEIADMFPGCSRITVVSDGTQLCCRTFRRILHDVWNADPAIIGAIGEDGEIIRDMILYAAARLGERAQFLHVNTIHDHILCMVENMINNDKSDFVPPPPEAFFSRMCASIRVLRDSLQNYHFFLSDCGKTSTGHTEHTLISNGRYYEDMDGMSPADWLRASLEGDATDAGSHHMDPS